MARGQDSSLFHVAGAQPRRLRITRVVGVFDKGNHHPLLCEMEDDSGPVGSWVVKPQRLWSASDQRAEYLVLSELAAAEVCCWLDVRTPAIGLTTFPPSVDEPALRASIAPLDAPELIDEVVEVYKMNRGLLAFCSRHIEGAVDVLPETLGYKWARPEVRRKGACVFVLDQFIQHDDRQRENPNLLWYQRELVAIDHGHAFTGIHSSGATGAALAGRTVLLAPRAFEDHILRAALAKLGCVEEVRKAARRLHKVQNTDIDRLATAWPEELDGARISRRPGQPPRARVLEFLRARRVHIVEAAVHLESLVSRK